MLDALRTAEDDVPPPALTLDEAEEASRALGLSDRPLDVLAVCWAAGRGELGTVPVVGRG